MFETEVTADKLAAFDDGVVHPVYGTFALGRDAEWACRLFVLEMLDAGEEGIGSYLDIEHLAPAPLNSRIRIIATLEEVKGIEVRCRYQVFSGERLIARGRQHQKIISMERFRRYLNQLRQEQEKRKAKEQ